MNPVTERNSAVVANEISKIDKLVKDISIVAQSKICSSDKGIIVFGNRKEVERGIVNVIRDVCTLECSYSRLELIQQVGCDPFLLQKVWRQIELAFGGALWIYKECSEWDDKIRNAICLYKLIKTATELKAILVLAENELDSANCSIVKTIFDRISKMVRRPEKVLKNMAIIVMQLPTCYKRAVIIEKLVSLEKKFLGKSYIDCANVTLVETGFDDTSVIPQHDKNGIICAIRDQGVVGLHPNMVLDSVLEVEHIYKVLSHCSIAVEKRYTKLNEIILTNIRLMSVDELDHLSKNIRKYSTLESCKTLIKESLLYKKLLTELENIVSIADFFKNIKHLKSMALGIQKKRVGLCDLRGLVKMELEARKAKNPTEWRNAQNSMLQKSALLRLNQLKTLSNSACKKLKTGLFFVTAGLFGLVGGLLGGSVGSVTQLGSMKNLTGSNANRGRLNRVCSKCVNVVRNMTIGALSGSYRGAERGVNVVSNIFSKKDAT